MTRLTIRFGDDAFAESVSPSRPDGVVFEGDEECGYFYAVDVSSAEPRIVHALQVYAVPGEDEASSSEHEVQIRWNGSGTCAALTIDGQVLAAFDFAHRLASSRCAFPGNGASKWNDVEWSDGLLRWFDETPQSGMQ